MTKPRRKDFRSDEFDYDFEAYAEKMDEYDVFVLEQEKEASQSESELDKKVTHSTVTTKKETK